MIANAGKIACVPGKKYHKGPKWYARYSHIQQPEVTLQPTLLQLERRMLAVHKEVTRLKRLRQTSSVEIERAAYTRRIKEITSL